MSHPDVPLWQEPNSGPFPENLSYLAENRLPDGDTVPQPPPEPELEPTPEPPWWKKAFWWPLSYRNR